MTQIAPMGGFPNRFQADSPNVTKGLRTLCASLAFLGMFSPHGSAACIGENPFLSASTDDRALATFREPSGAMTWGQRICR